MERTKEPVTPAASVSGNHTEARRPKARKFSRRALRGLAIVAAGGQIRKVNDELFFVKSQKGTGEYRVEWNGGKWSCECEDHAERGKNCKHIYAVNFLLDLPNIVVSNTEASDIVCPRCGSSEVVKRGLKYNKGGSMQIYWCRNCDRRFVDTPTGTRGGTMAAIGLIALDLHFKGVSLRNIRDHLWQIYNVSKPISTLQFWVTKLTGAVAKAAESITPEVGDKWLADEMVVKVRGDPKYMWNIMDYDTRRLIASLIVDGRGVAEALAAIKKAITVVGRPPKELVTDGLQSYRKAIQEMGIGIKHTENVALARKGDNNNRIERLHGTLRSWARSKRGLKDGSKLAEGYAAYYNHLRPSMSRHGEVPVGSKTKLRLSFFIKDAARADQPVA